MAACALEHFTGSVAFPNFTRLYYIHCLASTVPALQQLDGWDVRCYTLRSLPSSGSGTDIADATLGFPTALLSWFCLPAEPFLFFPLPYCIITPHTPCTHTHRDLAFGIYTTHFLTCVPIPTYFADTGTDDLPSLFWDFGCTFVLVAGTPCLLFTPMHLSPTHSSFDTRYPHPLVVLCACLTCPLCFPLFPQCLCHVCPTP